jgi:hypothetical protein
MAFPGFSHEAQSISTGKDVVLVLCLEGNRLTPFDGEVGVALLHEDELLGPG